jgi:hypothetical protein
VWFDGLNRFYVARERADLAQFFFTPPNVFDRFRRADEVALEARALAAEARLRIELGNVAELQTNMRSQRQAFEAELDNLRKKRAAERDRSIEAGLNSLRQRLEDERDHRTSLAGTLDQLLSDVQWAQKPLRIRLLFRRTGKPKYFVRRAMFHSSGRPRSLFRSIVMHRDGRPRRSFKDWMSSEEYQRRQRMATDAELARKPRWVRLLFRDTGKPKHLLRLALFHNSGKPRSLFRSLVLQPDGCPRGPFQQWMSSYEYQRLRGAVRTSTGSAVSSSDMISRDAELVARRIAAFRRTSSQ